MPTPPPAPLDYDTPILLHRRTWVSVPLAFSLFTFAAGVTVFSFFIAPRLQAMYKDFGARLPAATTLLLAAARFISAGGWVLLWAIAIVPPVVAPLLTPARGPAVPRPRRRYHSLFTFYFLTALLLLALLLTATYPMMLLINSISGSPQGR
jgi:hypothetical protein